MRDLIVMRHKHVRILYAGREVRQRQRGAAPAGGRVDLDTLDEGVWKIYFRQEVNQLVKVLKLPEVITSEGNEIVEPARDPLCMLLARLTYPNRYTVLRLKFGWEVTRISRIQAAVQDIILETWKHLLEFDEERLIPEKLQEYADVINAKIPVGALPNCWGFVDGTVRPTSRPTKYQRTVYNGWKWTHGVKYHAIVTPDGLMAHLYGPLEGRRHDRTLWQESQIFRHLQMYAYRPEGNALQVYGDSAYGCNKFLCSPFMGARLSEGERLFNRRMANVQIIVEWVFKETLNLFDFKRNQKFLLQPIGKQFQVAILLHNAHVCLHNPQIPQYFQNPDDLPVEMFHPSTLEEYFHD